LDTDYNSKCENPKNKSKIKRIQTKLLHVENHDDGGDNGDANCRKRKRKLNGLTATHSNFYNIFGPSDNEDNKWNGFKSKDILTVIKENYSNPRPESPISSTSTSPSPISSTSVTPRGTRQPIEEERDTMYGMQSLQETRRLWEVHELHMNKLITPISLIIVSLPPLPPLSFPLSLSLPLLVKVTR
jgi:hypothetical protein